MSHGRRLGLTTYLFAAAVGLIGGLVGTAFQALGRVLQWQIVGDGTLLDAARDLSWYQALLIPFGGAVVAAFLAYGLTRGRASQGMGDVMEAVTLKRARLLSIRATVSRALSSLALIVTGGSVGREGPIAYMAASFGARFARLVKVPAPRLGVFAGCGIAAGMSASYFAPLGAALFAVEVVLGNFAVDVFGPVVVAAVVASLVVEALAGGPLSGVLLGSPLYDLPKFSEGHPVEILVYVVLGCVAACGGWLFIKSMRWTEQAFRKIPVSPLIRLPIGGLMIGLIGIWLPHVWGNGYHAVNHVFEQIANQSPVLGLVALLFIMKILATSITLGSGGSGGIFTPTMFIGVAMGYAVGAAAHALMPGVVPEIGPYAVVGMAAAIAATTQAPITAIFLLFELTRETGIVLPLMVSAITASLTARALGMEGIYVAALKRRGVSVPEGIEETALTTTHVTDLMRGEAAWIRDNATFDMIVAMVQKTRRDHIYVLSKKEKLLGVIRLHDVKNFLADPELGPVVIAADLTVTVPRVYETQTLAEILEIFDDPELHEIPIVHPETGTLVGVIDRRDVISALSVEVLQTHHLRAKFVEHAGAQHYVEIPEGHALSRIGVPEAMVGRTLGEANFRAETGVTVLTIVRRHNGREERLLPQASLELRADDALVVMGPEEDVRRLGGET